MLPRKSHRRQMSLCHQGQHWTTLFSMISRGPWRRMQVVGTCVPSERRFEVLKGNLLVFHGHGWLLTLGRCQR